MASSADTPRARALGVELREARQQRGLSVRKLAELIDRSASHVSRWETGKLCPTETDTATVLSALGVNGASRGRLLELARDASDPNWVTPGIDKQLAALTEYERTAKTITNVEPMLIPGLLQTYDYAHHVISAFSSSLGETTQRAHMRIGRQHVLTSASPKDLVAVIGEAALRYSTCPHEVMVQQLNHLLQVGSRDNVTIQILPIDRPHAAMLCGAWALIHFANTTPIVHLEHYSSSSTITDTRTVRQYECALDDLREVAALSPGKSVDLIRRIAEEEE